MVRILHLIDSMDPASGGPPRVAARLAAAQLRLGHQAQIVTHRRDGDADRLAEMLQGIPTGPELPILDLRRPGLLRGLGRGRLAGPLGPLVRQADVVHLHCVWDPIVRGGAAAAAQAGVPYFVQPNGMLDPRALASKWLKKQLGLALVLRPLLNAAAALVLGNQQEANLIGPLRLSCPMEVLPLNAVFMEEIDPLPPAGRFYARYPQLQGRPFAVFLGRLHHKKGLDYLAEAFALVAPRHPQVQLVVVGHDDGAQADFQARIARYGLGERVHLVGAAHGAAKWEAYRDAACFVLPSRQEGFSIAITEALAAGLPVVITRPCNFDEVEQAGAGLVTELNAQSFAAGLDRLLSDAELRGRMGRAARELVLERFSCPRMAEQMMAVYARRRVPRRPPAPRRAA